MLTPKRASAPRQDAPAVIAATTRARRSTDRANGIGASSARQRLTLNAIANRSGAALEAVESAFGADVDYAQLVKLYGTPPGTENGRYSPGECTGTRKTTVEGRPDTAHVSTSYVERQNLTMRMHMRRFTRLTNAFSKKVENYAYAVALHFMYYNFVRLHSMPRVSPVMAAAVTDRLSEIVDIVALLAAVDKKSVAHGSYKKREST